MASAVGPGNPCSGTRWAQGSCGLCCRRTQGVHTDAAQAPSSPYKGVGKPGASQGWCRVRLGGAPAPGPGAVGWGISSPPLPGQLDPGLLGQLCGPRMVRVGTQAGACSSWWKAMLATRLPFQRCFLELS